MKQGKPQVIFPGDWIEYVIDREGHWERRLGRVMEITDEGYLYVAYGQSRWNPHEAEQTFYTEMIELKRVLKRYSRFMVLPIPGKVEDEEFIS